MIVLSSLYVLINHKKKKKIEKSKIMRILDYKTVISKFVHLIEVKDPNFRSLLTALPTYYR